MGGDTTTDTTDSVRTQPKRPVCPCKLVVRGGANVDAYQVALQAALGNMTCPHLNGMESSLSSLSDGMFMFYSNCIFLLKSPFPFFLLICFYDRVKAHFTVNSFIVLMHGSSLVNADREIGNMKINSDIGK